MGQIVVDTEAALTVWYTCSYKCLEDTSAVVWGWGHKYACHFLVFLVDILAIVYTEDYFYGKGFIFKQQPFRIPIHSFYSCIDSKIQASGL